MVKNHKSYTTKRYYPLILPFGQVREIDWISIIFDLHKTLQCVSFSAISINFQTRLILQFILTRYRKYSPIICTLIKLFIVNFLLLLLFHVCYFFFSYSKTIGAAGGWCAVFRFRVNQVMDRIVMRGCNVPRTSRSTASSFDRAAISCP